MTINQLKRCRFVSDSAQAILYRATVCVGLALIIAWSVGCRPNTAEDYLGMGYLAMRDGKVDEAEKDYQNASQLAPDDPRVHLALGNLYAKERKLAFAEQEQMKAILLDPKNPLPHAALAELYADRSQPVMSEEQYRAATALDTANPKYHFSLALLLVKEKQFAEAETEFRTSIGLDPTNAQEHFSLAGLLNAESGRQDEAQGEYAQAKALDPESIPPAPALSAAPSPTPALSTTLTSMTPTPRVKPFQRRFLLTKDSRVYQQPDDTSPIVGSVQKNKFVRITGIADKWLQVRLRSGTVGFIPESAAE